MDITPALVAFRYVTDNPLSSAVIAGVALLVLWLVYLIIRKITGGIFRAVRYVVLRWVTPRAPEDILTVVAAAIATGVSAEGMWRFAGDVLSFGGFLRVCLFGFIEVGMMANAVRARRNMRATGSAGVDGLAVWMFTCLSAVLSAMDAKSFPETIFRLIAPLVAAWLWERGMSIERQRLTGRTRINWRVTPERVLVRIGLAESSDRTATEVDTHRRLTRVAQAAKKAQRLREAGAFNWRQRYALTKLDKAMDRAIEHTGLVQDPAMQKRLLAQIGALYNAAALRDLQPHSFWQEPKELSDFNRLALETSRMNEGFEVRGEIREARDEMNEARSEIREAMANLVPLAALATGGRVVDNRLVGGDISAPPLVPVSLSNATQNATGGGDNPQGDTAAGGDNRGRHNGRQTRPPRRTVPASGRRRSSTTARTRQGDTTGDTKGDNAQRVVEVVKLLGQEPPPKQRDIAKRFGVTVRTVQRDIELAEKKGLLPPGDTTSGTTGDTTSGAAPDAT